MAKSGQQAAKQSRALRGAELSRSIGISHLSWTFDRDSTSALSGEVVSRGIGAIRISWIRLALGLGEWSGQRAAINIQSNPEPYLIVVMPIEGSIALTSATASNVIAQQELAVWDSTQALGFELKGGCYEQISALVPQRVLRANAQTCAALHCAHVDKDNVLSELCVQHMMTLSKFLNSQLRPYEISLSTVTTSLFDAVIASLYRAPRDRDLLLEEIKNYIECYITDDTLSPKTIAAAFEISTRYAHKLFEFDGNTISEWILNRRLDRSAEDLAAPSTSITEVAFRWGFKDLGHYSRTFKARFGKPPSVFRREACGGSDDDAR
jgi:AraC family transcriptional activator of tynA and feaB